MAFCPNCGKKMTGGAFCTNCGAPVRTPGGTHMQQSPGGAYMPQTAPQKKSRMGLGIGLGVGGTVLVAGIVFLILFLLGVFDNKDTTVTPAPGISAGTGGSGFPGITSGPTSDTGHSEVPAGISGTQMTEEEPEEEPAAVAGYWRLSSIFNGTTDIAEQDLESMGYGNPDNYLVLAEDGTGYMMFMYSIEELTWDEEMLRFAFNNETYSVDGDTLEVSYGENASLTFVRSTEAAPEKPEMTDATGMVSLINSSEQSFGEILFVPSTMSFADSSAWPASGAGEVTELDLSLTGGVFPGRFDLALYDPETGVAVSTYYLELYDGYSIEYKIKDEVPVFVIRDLAGNELTIEAQVDE